VAEDVRRLAPVLVGGLCDRYLSCGGLGVADNTDTDAVRLTEEG
jgi:hypothetical protein